MTNHPDYNETIDMNAPTTPPSSSSQLKRRAESPHPEESASKRVFLEEGVAAADVEDSSDEFVDAEEELTTSQNFNEGASTWTTGDIGDGVSLNGPSEVGEAWQNQFHRAAYQNQFEDDLRNFAEIIGPHGQGNGLDEDEIGAQGITAEQHAEFMNELDTNGDQQYQESEADEMPAGADWYEMALAEEPVEFVNELEPCEVQKYQESEADEMPSRADWNEMTLAEQDRLLDLTTDDVEDDGMPPPYTSNEQAERDAWARGFDSEAESNAFADQDLYQVGNGHETEEQAEFGAEDYPDADDLFASTFGNQSIESDSDIEEVDPTGDYIPAANNRAGPTKPFQKPTPAENNIRANPNDPTIVRSLNASKFTYEPTSINNTSPSSPPPAPTSQPSSTTTTHNNNSNSSSSNIKVNKTRTPTTLQNPTLPSPQIIIPRSLSPNLRTFHNLHTHISNLIPHLPNWSLLSPRRYWIAILPLDSPKSKISALKNLSEKDLVWMKGNRFSTISTMWHSYQTRTMCDPEDFVLVNRGEVLDMQVLAEELDWFGDRLVVLKAMRMGEVEGERRRSGVLNGVGVVPERRGEVIELD